MVEITIKINSSGKYFFFAVLKHHSITNLYHQTSLICCVHREG
uniref:Uncharacterized protein n=1 Tax=Arundo donax TaxID=35708 RepID=A0A0A8YUG0_ARUDO